MKSEAASIASHPRGVYARVLHTGLLCGYALICVVALIFRDSAVARGLLSGTTLFLSSLIAAAICFSTWRSLSRPGNHVWLIMGCAALVACLAHTGSLLGNPAASLTHLTWFIANVLVLAAVGYAVHDSERGRLTELALDIALVVTAASLVIVRWAPGARAVFGTDSGSIVFLTVFNPVVALSALMLGAVLVTNRKAVVGDGTLTGLAAAIGCMVIAAAPQVVTPGACCSMESWRALPAIGMWVFISYAAVRAWSDGQPAVASNSGERLRQFVAPTVAIVLSTISLDVALRPPIGPRTAIALGVLGALVALRLSELLSATRLQVTERRELAQTRALVEVSRALAGKNDLDETLRIVTHWAVRVLNARGAAVELLSADGRTLELRSAEGLPEEGLGRTFPVDSSFTGWVVLNGEPRVTSNPRRDPFLTEESLRFINDSPVAAVPLRYRERLLGVLFCVGTRAFDASDLDLLRAFANQTALALEDARMFEQVRALSVTDPLTGLANRRLLDREMLREFAAAQRGRRLVVVMFDLDDFKLHNDKFGHLAGDEALRHFGEALRTVTRTMNIAARYGGDEFIALLADADVHGAQIFISRVRERFNANMDAARRPRICVSAGLAEYNDDMKTPEDLVQAADRALYAEKFDVEVRA